jgi:peptidyl-prolyl cis-trans isomerase SurA
LKTLTPILLVALLAAPAGSASAQRTVDRVAAVVNGDVITLSELTQRAGAEYRRAMDMPPGPARDQARSRALRTAYDSVLAERLVEAEVKTLGIEVTEAQIDGAIEDVKKRNNLSDEVLKQALAAEGMTITAYRARLRKDFENHLLIAAKVQNRVKVTDDDVQGYYQTHLSEFAGEEQAKLRLILLQVAAGAPAAEDARVKAAGETLLTRLAAGEDFADLARQVSQGPGAASGGDLGWVKKGTMPIDLERVAFALAPGQNSGLIRAKTGWIILKADDRRSAKAPPIEEVRDRIREKIGNQQAETYRKQYLQELKSEALIELKIPELEAPPAGS